MPKLQDHQSALTTKMLMIGDQGAGKTGSICSLAEAGYNIRILDLDNGIDVVKNLLLSPKTIYKRGSADRVSYSTLTDSLRIVNNKLLPKATVWNRATKLLENWKISDDENFGPIQTWTPNDVLVIDGLTRFADAAMNAQLAMNNRLGQPPHQADYGAAQGMMESVLQLLYDEKVVCNVIMMCHIAYIGGDATEMTGRGYPRTIGKALSPKVGSYFNTVVMVKSTGSGAHIKQKIHTRNVGTVELKNSAPLDVKPEYDLPRGLAEFFADLRASNAKPIAGAAASPIPIPTVQSISLAESPSAQKITP